MSPRGLYKHFQRAPWFMPGLLDAVCCLLMLKEYRIQNNRILIILWYCMQIIDDTCTGGFMMPLQAMSYRQS